jgi:hypothetical protein
MCKVIEINGSYVLRDEWDLEDIQNQAENMDIQLSKDQVLKVMYWIAKTYDTNYGINWDSIDSAIEYVMESNNENTN